MPGHKANMAAQRKRERINKLYGGHRNWARIKRKRRQEKYAEKKAKKKISQEASR